MKYILIGICIFLVSPAGYGQSLPRKMIDSMRRVLQHSSSDSQRAGLMAEISLQLGETYPDSALHMAREAAATAMAAGQRKVYALCLQSIGWSYSKMESYDSAELYLTRSIAVFHDQHDDRAEAHAWINITTLYDYQGKNEKTLDCLMKGLRLMEGLHDSLGKAYAEEMIGACYEKQSLPESALPYLENAVQVFRSLHQDAFLGPALLHLGQVYVALKKYDSAFIVFRAGGAAYQRSDFIAGVGSTAELMADIFLTRSNRQLVHPDTDSALYYYQLAYRIYLKTNRVLLQGCEKMSIGETLLLLRRYDEAVQDLNEALAIFVREKSAKYCYQTTLFLSQSYKAKGDYKRAVDYLEQSGVYKDSLDATNRKEVIAAMFAKYETDKKDKTIQLLNAQKALTDKELSRNRAIALFSFCLVALLILLAVVLWKQVRIRQELKEVQMRNQIASDLHDDIGSSLSSILLLSNMTGGVAGNQDGQSTLGKIGHTAREVMEKMSDIVWTMNPLNDEGISIKERIEKLARQVQEILGLPIAVTISPRLEELKIPMELRKNIFFIFKEALNNIVKHADASTVGLSIDIHAKQLRLAIKDDGKGFDCSASFRGNGMGIMADRARACGGTFNIDSHCGQGTRVEVVLPIPRSRYLFSAWK